MTHLRLGLIPKKDIEDKRGELVGYYRACEPYLTNDMRIAIRNEDGLIVGIHPTLFQKIEENEKNE